MQQIQIASTGGPEVLSFVEAETPSPASSQVLVEVKAAGVNFIDTYQRTGLYPVELPFALGLEGAGVVTEVGTDVDHIAVGETVAWAGQPGSYSTHCAVLADQCVIVPRGVSAEIAAAVMLQGMTAHYLAVDTWPLQPGDKCLVHAGAGGVGLLLIQIAKMRGAEVFTTVGSEQKAAAAREAGADHVILYRDVDFAAEVERIAGPNALAVIYDGVGADTFTAGMGQLRKRGMMVTYGNASGPVPPVSPLELSAAGSVFLTRPTLFDYLASPAELEARAADIFDWITESKLKVTIGDRFPLAEAAAAHEALEGRRTMGKVLLVP